MYAASRKNLNFQTERKKPNELGDFEANTTHLFIFATIHLWIEDSKHRAFKKSSSAFISYGSHGRENLDFFFLSPSIYLSKEKFECPNNVLPLIFRDICCKGVEERSQKQRRSNHCKMFWVPPHFCVFLNRG